MDNYPHRPIAPEVFDYLEQFEWAEDPNQILTMHDERRLASQSGDIEDATVFGNFVTALMLYPQDCVTDTAPAVGLYEAFAYSRNPDHAELIIRLLPKLWEYDREGARRIAEQRLMWPSTTEADARIHNVLEVMLRQSYLVGRTIVGDRTEDGVVLLTSERLRRRPQAS